MKIVSVDKVIIYPDHIKELKKYGEVIIFNDVPDEQKGVKRIKNAEIVIDNWFEMPAKVISSCPKLKMICVAATGYEWVDIKEAEKRSIVVSNSPNYGTEAVAEHTIGLLLSASRLAFQAGQDIKNGNWDTTVYKGKELKEKILGIIGYGAIGRRVAEICQTGFGMKTLYINTSSSRQDFENLLKNSDFISINAPLTEKTKGMLGKKEFNLMKKGVVLVNTGRGAIIQEEVLVKNLQSGKIFAVGLDVLTKEPMDKTNPLFSFSNVIITPHIGYNSEEAEYRLSEIVMQNVISFIKDKPQNVITSQ